MLLVATELQSVALEIWGTERLTYFMLPRKSMVNAFLESRCLAFCSSFVFDCVFFFFS